MLSFIGAALAYVWIALFQDYWETRKLLRNEIEPQADEVQKSQTTTFLDANKGYNNSDFSGVMDDTRSDSMKQDVPLGDFFSRPLRLASFDWKPGDPPIDEYYDVWQMFFSDPYVKQRVANFRLLQCKLHVKFVLNGNAFFYGRLLASYNPQAGYDSWTRARTINADLVGLSQKPHLYLDPTTSTGGEMILPFYHFNNAIDLIFPDLLGMGSIRVRSINDLKHANGASDTIVVNMFVWAEDVKLAVPTSADIYVEEDFRAKKIAALEIEPQADEYGVGPISRPATALATIASNLRAPPWLSPYAKATSIGASAISKIASIFGYSRPPIVDPKVYRTVAKGSFANSNVDDDVNKLSLDVKQELTIDSRVDGLSGQDELGILDIAQHESYWTTFGWPVTTSQESMLWNCVVSPASMYRIYGSGSDTEHHLTAPAFATLPFSYWRGTMRYRFQVVCSAYHRGRLKIVYDPWNCQSTTPYNTNYTTIVDITDKTDFSIDVGWGQPYSWQSVGDFGNPESLQFNTTPLVFYDPAYSRGNGILAVYVVNELTVPNSTIDNDIQINVFVSVGDDFEVAAPSAQYLSRLRLQTLNGVDPVPSPIIEELEEEPLPPTEEIEPQSDEVEANHNTKLDGDMDKPEEENPVTTMAGMTNPVDNMKLVHFGETFSSFRPLLKRYMIHEILPIPDSPSGAQLFSFQRQAMPFEPGYTEVQGPLPGYAVPTLIAGRAYARANMTHLKYISSAFVGWKGGIRYVVDATSSSCCDNVSFHGATRYTSCTPENNSKNFELTSGASYNDLKEYTGFEGATYQPPSNNPFMNFEIPFYSKHRFCPARLQTEWETSFERYDFQPCFKVSSVGNFLPNDYFVTQAAAGDDFTCSFFVGAPPLHIEPIMP